MKKIIIMLLFLFIIVINAFLGFLLYRYNNDEFTIKNIIYLVLFSYLIFLVLNAFLFFLFKIHLNSTLYFTLIFGLVSASIITFVILLNFKSNPILFLPLMMLSSIISSFVIWIYFIKFKK